MKYYEESRKGENTDMAGLSFQVGGKLNMLLYWISVSLGLAAATALIWVTVWVMQ